MELVVDAVRSLPAEGCNRLPVFPVARLQTVLVTDDAVTLCLSECPWERPAVDLQAPLFAEDVGCSVQAYIYPQFGELLHQLLPVQAL